MKKVFLISGIIFGLLISVVLLAILLGQVVPEEHSITKSAVFHQTPAMVWATITDYAEYPSWRPDLEKVEVLVDESGKPMWREYGKYNQELVYRTVETDSLSRLVIELADKESSIQGGWEILLKPVEDEGCKVTITENGVIRNPLYRFFAHYIFGLESTVDSYLIALHDSFSGEQPD